MKTTLILMRAVVFGGAERFIVNYLNHIDHSLRRVVWGVLEDNFSNRLSKNGSLTHVVTFPRREKQRGFIGNALVFLRFLTSQKPDMVILNQFAMESFWFIDVLTAFLVSRGNVVIIVHDCIPLCSPYLRHRYFGCIPALGLVWGRKCLGQRLTGYLSRRVIAVSSEVRDMLVNMYGFPKNKISVLYHGVDTTRFFPVSAGTKRALRSQFGLPADAVVIALTSRFDDIKRPDRVLAAFVKLAKTRNDIWIALAGTGPSEARLYRQVQRLPDAIKARVRFTGFLDDPLPLYQTADIFVLGSESEGLPLALLEAMACGLVTVVTHSGGPAEVIRHGENGFLVEKTWKGVLRGLQEALSLSPEQARAISLRAQKVIRERFELIVNLKEAFRVIGLPGKFDQPCDLAGAPVLLKADETDDQCCCSRV